MSGPTILDKNFKNGGVKVARRTREFKIFKCSVIIVLSQPGYRIKVYVYSKVTLSTDSWNTAKDICAVNRCTIPSITSCNTSRTKYIVNVTLFTTQP